METLRKVRSLIFSLVLRAVFFTGCETTHRVRRVDKPTARVVSLTQQAIKLGRATLLFGIEIENAYPTSLSLVGLSYGLTSGGGTFITAAPIDHPAVPPNKRQIVTLPDEVIYARLLKALNSKPGSTVPYRARLWLQVDIPNLGQVGLPLSHEGRLVFPELPEVNKEDSNKHTIYSWKSPLTKDKEKGHSWRDSFSRWSLESTSRRFAVCAPSKLRLNQLSWTVWPLHADICYAK